MTLSDDIRKLADVSTQIGQRLNNKVNDITAKLNTVLTGLNHLDDADLFDLAEAQVNQMLSYLCLALTHYRDDIEVLRNNAEQIHHEIGNVLVALQFQDRVSQILTQVENNLLLLQQTIENIQQQGNDRDSNMLKVNEAVEHIEENYKSVNPDLKRNKVDSDDLTFF